MKYKLLCEKRTSYQANEETKSDYKIITKHNKEAWIEAITNRKRLGKNATFEKRTNYKYLKRERHNTPDKVAWTKHI